MTELEQMEYDKGIRAKRMMLWFGIISLIMSFAAFTSAFLVSSGSDDRWIDNFSLPTAFFWSTGVIILSSISMYFAFKYVKNEQRSLGMAFLFITLILGLTFMGLQLFGFNQIMTELGYYFTGETSNITYTYIFLIAAVHVLHVAAAVIALGVVIYNHYKQRYNKEQTLGIELAATFWHFVDLLWIYLFCFLYFVR